MDKHKSKKILNFFNNMQSTGTISREEVLTLESALGEAIVTPSVKINELSSTPSKMGYETVYAVINKVIESENITSGEITTIPEAMAVMRKTFGYLKQIKMAVTNMSSIFSEETKNKLLDSKSRYSFYDENGTLVEYTRDVLNDYNGAYSFINNLDYLASISGKSKDELEELVERYIDHREAEFSTTIENNNLTSILHNKELSNITSGRAFMFSPVTAMTYIEVFSDGEEILEGLCRTIEDLEYEMACLVKGVKDGQYIEINYVNSYCKRLEIFNERFEKDKFTLAVYKLVHKILS